MGWIRYGGRASDSDPSDPAQPSVPPSAATQVGRHDLARGAPRGHDLAVDGVASFEAKRRVGTLPDGVDARYVLGIVRNLSERREGVAVAEKLLRARLDPRFSGALGLIHSRAPPRSTSPAPLVRVRDAVRLDVPALRDRVLRCTDIALAARGVDRLLSLLAVAEEMVRHASAEPAPLVCAFINRGPCRRRRRSPWPPSAEPRRAQARRTVAGCRSSSRTRPP